MGGNWGLEEDLTPIISGAKVEGAQLMGARDAGARHHLIDVIKLGSTQHRPVPIPHHHHLLLTSGGHLL